MTDEIWITVIATRFDSAFAQRHRRLQDGQREPREPRSRERERHERDGRGEEVGRYSDPSGDWRDDRSGNPSLHWARTEGRGRDRRPTEPGTGTRGGLVLDVPEFIPDD